jgi:hypothetical protein
VACFRLAERSDSFQVTGANPRELWLADYPHRGHWRKTALCGKCVSITPKANTLAQRFSQEYAKVILPDVNMEDGSTMERTQTMLASGAKKQIVLQDQELVIRQHHKVTKSYLNGHSTVGASLPERSLASDWSWNLHTVFAVLLRAPIGCRILDVNGINLTRRDIASLTFCARAAGTAMADGPVDRLEN